jgi:hypothetical protein
MKSRKTPTKIRHFAWGEVEGYIQLGMDAEARASGLRLMRKGIKDLPSLGQITDMLMPVFEAAGPGDKDQFCAALMDAIQALPPKEQCPGFRRALILSSVLQAFPWVARFGLPLLRNDEKTSDNLNALVFILLSGLDPLSAKEKKEYREALDGFVEALPPRQHQSGLGHAFVFYSSMGMKREARSVLLRLRKIPKDPMQVAMALDLLKRPQHEKQRDLLMQQGHRLLQKGVKPPTDQVLREAMGITPKKFLK